MKMTSKAVALTGTLILFFATGSVKAEMTNLVSLTITALTQGGASDNGTVTTTAAPVKQSVKNVNILPFLAQDEHAEGNSAATFPSDAKLVAITDTNNVIIAFQVLTSSNTFLVDVSDLISIAPGSVGASLSSGKQNDQTHLANTSSNILQSVIFTYDDSSVIPFFGPVANVTFYVVGFMTTTVNDSKPNNAGAYTKTLTLKLTSGVGEANFNGTMDILSGGLTATSKASYTLP